MYRGAVLHLIPYTLYLIPYNSYLSNDEERFKQEVRSISNALQGSKKGEDVKVKYSSSEFNSVVVEGISKAELSSIEGIKSIY